MIHYRNDGKSARSIEATSFIEGMEIFPQAKTPGFQGGKPGVKAWEQELLAARSIHIVINDVAAELGDAAKSLEVGLLDEHGSKNREVLFFHQQFGDDSIAQFIDLLGRQRFIHRTSLQAWFGVVTVIYRITNVCWVKYLYFGRANTLCLFRHTIWMGMRPENISKKGREQ
ncbi:hypothetical protein LG52_2130 [Geobacillus kaustophilus]|uniref:Uncharacterized protein n=1 Tax=Geobacillus kaustophilus TaxID=1462 RepID=A0A0D8BVN3_GEOKU|nr:hypothetical protein LG52_2130 [Geobacillus kaustophilus]